MTDIKREYIIPLRRGFANTPRYKRTQKAVRVLKEFLVKNMKSDNIKLGKKLNEFLWKDGIKNPPGKVKVVATKDKENVVRAELFGFDYVDFKPVQEGEEPKGIKEKLQAKVKGAKEDVKQKSVDGEQKPAEEEPVAHEVKKGTPRNAEGDKKPEAVNSKPKAETKPAEKKVEAKVEKPKVETKTETPKVEEKIESSSENPEKPKAE